MNCGVWKMCRMPNLVKWALVLLMTLMYVCAAFQPKWNAEINYLLFTFVDDDCLVVPIEL